MSETTKVSPAEVHALSSFVGGKSREIESTLTDLETQVGRLKASWDGEAKDAYDIAQREWAKQINEMNALLGRVSGKLVEVADGYTATDRRGAGRFAV